MIEPTLHPPNADHRGVLAWALPDDTAVLSSAPVSGGLTRPRWLVNIGVPADYARTDLDAHVREVATELGLEDSGVAMLTAADVGRVSRSEGAGVVAHATVAVSKPTWAADASGGWSSWSPGTINIVVQVGGRLTSAAAVNAVMTITEAKTQALIEAGIPGTGTATDAVAVLWSSTGVTPIAFAGPRAEWGANIALAVRGAVANGIECR